MKYENLTIKAQDALNGASALAQKGDHGSIEGEHLLLALLEQKDGLVPPLLARIGADAEALAGDCRARIAALPKVYGDAAQVYLSPGLSKALAKAEGEASALKDDFVSTEHILLALAGGGGGAGDVLKKYGVDRQGILEALKALRGNSRVTDQNPEDKYQALEKYCRDLTALARQEKIDPVIGRDEEIRRVMQVLSRRTKNNPVLIGEPGVGK
ncbi:MAG: type VI secretion system ATPase TssH, partial [Spirochaetaceae bacterium]|nr:type VI secretion system ATPase TssH [Spirochaetaceae bacterium]